MKLSQPIWNPVFAGFLVRVPLGTYFILDGKMKLSQLHNHIAEIRQIKSMSDEIATLYATTAPFLEMLIGGLLILGLWTSLAAIGVGLILAANSYVQHLELYQAQVLHKDVMIFSAALSLLASGAGFLSIDNFRSKS